MILKKITIENFKSIRDEISFEIKEIANKKCFVLLGINESGKSNILEAISLLSDGEEVNYDTDCNNKAEENGESIEITYELEIVGYDYYYEKKFTEKGLNENLAKSIIIEKIEKKIEIEADNTRSDVLWVYINDNTEEFEKYIINEESQTIEILKKMLESITSLINFNFGVDHLFLLQKKKLHIINFKSDIYLMLWPNSIYIVRNIFI